MVSSDYLHAVCIGKGLHWIKQVLCRYPQTTCTDQKTRSYSQLRAINVSDQEQGKEETRDSSLEIQSAQGGCQRCWRRSGPPTTVCASTPTAPRSPPAALEATAPTAVRAAAPNNDHGRTLALTSGGHININPQPMLKRWTFPVCCQSAAIVTGVEKEPPCLGRAWCSAEASEAREWLHEGVTANGSCGEPAMAKLVLQLLSAEPP